MNFRKKNIISFGVISIMAIAGIGMVLFSRMLPSIQLQIFEGNKAVNYLDISDDILFRQTLNNCAPYSVMGVVNVLTGKKPDPEVLAGETTWRIMKNLTFPQGLIDLLRKNNIKTREYSMKLYSQDQKVIWLKNRIDSGNPVILLVKVKGIQHYFTVIGYDQEGFMLYDSLQEKRSSDTMLTVIDKPEYPGNRYYKNGELTGLWDKGGYKIFFRNWAVVCGPWKYKKLRE